MVDIIDYMDIKTAARRLCVTRQNVEYHIGQDHIKTEVHMGKTVIHKHALHAFIWSEHYHGQKSNRENDDE